MSSPSTEGFPPRGVNTTQRVHHKNEYEQVRRAQGKAVHEWAKKDVIYDGIGTSAYVRVCFGRFIVREIRRVSPLRNAPTWTAFASLASSG